MTIQTTASNVDDLGLLAYEIYREHTHGVSLLSGRMLPPWEELDEGLQDAWQAAAAAVEDAVGTQLPPEPEVP